ncbi:Rv3235 family protein [Flaviflexus huanghaiensis]|uniref:Rv3235 family protein n=1 Tax=Flaviflexus huanghaiensis TaxID=1111473 RepID=UPI0015FDE1C1|nr:Rv3235 family protein [Flaviflexus huanghaiensis]
MPDTLSATEARADFVHAPTRRVKVAPGGPPDPTPIVRAIAAAAVEVLNGHRSVRQLQRWLAPHIYMALAQRAGIASRCGKRISLPARVISSRTCFPTPLVCEAAVVVWDVNRPRACTVRLEIHRGRWRANALDVI